MHAVLEARRAAPAILHLPHLQLWWDTAPPSLRATLWMLLADLPGDLPLLLMASADVPFDQLDEVLELHTALLLSLCCLDAVTVPRKCKELQRGLPSYRTGLEARARCVWCPPQSGCYLMLMFEMVSETIF